MDELISLWKGDMERFIVKDPHISPPQNQKISKSLGALYAINIEI
jgi:hypothetical protein